MTAILPQPETQFLDNNGNILAGGMVYTYIPNTLTPKTTWQDDQQATNNTNPVVLDSAGRCIMYGQGDYLITLTDNLGNEVYSKVTKSSLDESAISAIMLPVVGAETLTQAQDLMGIPELIQTSIDGIALLPGPTGPVGPTGPIGPQGVPGTGAFNIQGFNYPGGTWNNPDPSNTGEFGQTVILQLWGAGGGGGIGAGGGGGGYSVITFPLSSLAGANEAVTCGAAGQPSTIGTPGQPTSFGGLITQTGGGGGSQYSPADAGGLVSAPSGYLSFLNTSVIPTLISVVQELSTYPGDGVIIQDAYGNPYYGFAGAGSPGQSLGLEALIPVVFGGQGGPANGNGNTPGGGGGANGIGGNGQVIVTVI